MKAATRSAMSANRQDRWATLATDLGVLLGLLMLVFEVHQNSNLMRAQISMDRTNNSMQILADLANGGDLVPIDVKLREISDEFPRALGWSTELTPEEERRYRFWMYARLAEQNNDWFQCQSGLIPQELCETEIVSRMRSSLHRYYEFKISFTRSQSSFIAEMQHLSLLEGLPAISNEGLWSPAPK